MRYIDFDGVILDTEGLLFEEWRKNPNRFNLPEIEKIKYVQSQDWNHIVFDSPTIDDSIYILKQLDPNENAILTKVHSMGNEAQAKYKWRRVNGIIIPMIIVPYQYKKTDIVVAKDNELYDDGLFNLDEWKEAGGIPYLVDPNDDNYDSWHKPNVNNYPRVKSLSKILK